MNAKEWDKLSSDYHEYIVSPLYKGVKNPIFQELKKIGSNCVVADIGCGRGELVPALSKQFKFVHAFDFSSKMIEHAKKNNSFSNVKYYVKDMKKLNLHKTKFDLALSINSILMPNEKDIKASMKSIYQILKKKGRFMAVFPSMESILYQAYLIHEKQLKKNNPIKAMKKAKKILEHDKYNFVNAVYNDSGECQKFYYNFELDLRLTDIGFKNIKISKVLYPWGISDYEDFESRPKMWDWFVDCTK
jgi:ubiquinone/menaquinone biosynthesis C-methylase UbiE